MQNTLRITALSGSACVKSLLFEVAAPSVRSLSAFNTTQTSRRFMPTVCPQNCRTYTTKSQAENQQDSVVRSHTAKLSQQRDLKHFKSRLQHEETDRSSSQGQDRLDISSADKPLGTYTLPHPIWSEQDVHSVTVTHRNPKGFVDNMAYYSVMLLRKSFDLFSGFIIGQRTEKKWLRRIIFLETVAGVPGMVAAMTRHLHSLRRLRRDHGWIHTLLEEAENERMHLMTAMTLSQPGLVFRVCVMGAQGIFVTVFSLAYLLSPRFCHRFVGYLEEEAVITYSKCVEDIRNGPMKHWLTQAAPDVAIRYWCLAENSTMLDVILAIRADESHHRDVNHTLASMDPEEFNPYPPGK